MDWLEQFFTNYREWLLAAFSGVGLAVVLWVFGFFRWLWERLFGRPSPPPTANIDAIVQQLAETARQLGAAEEREQSFEGREQRYQETIRELTSAVEALVKQAEAPDAPPGIDVALEQLAGGKTEAAEAIFQQVLDRKGEFDKFLKFFEQAPKIIAEAARSPLGIVALVILVLFGLALVFFAVALVSVRVGIFIVLVLGFSLFAFAAMRRMPKVRKAVKAEGEPASKEAAAARHIGALAYLRDTQKALSAYAQAVELDPENPDGLNMLGLLRHRVGDLDGATESYERVLRLGNTAEDKAVVATAYGNLGIIYQTRGDLAKAEEYYLKSLAINEELGHKEGMANDYGNLGIVYKTRGDLAKAEEYHLKSLTIEEELGRKEGMASDYGSLGNVYRTRGDLAKAEEFYLKALAIDSELGRKEGVARSFGNLGNVYFMREDLAKAEEYMLKALAIDEELDRKEGMATHYGNLGNVYFMREDFAKAEEFCLKALTIEEEVDRKVGMAIQYGNLGNLYLTQGDLVKACEAWGMSRRLFRELGAAPEVEKVQALMDDAGCAQEDVDTEDEEG